MISTANSALFPELYHYSSLGVGNIAIGVSNHPVVTIFTDGESILYLASSAASQGGR